ncbi:MAG: GNAT family N-acetyltransferase [Planctomycetota bacterium]|jgi:ribosomal protein S18 acetylase RimI-like enzyme
MTDNELAAHADANYFDWWRVWASAVEGGEVREQDGLLIAATGAPQAWWNIAIVTGQLSEPERKIRQGIAYFDGRHQPFILRIRDGVDPASERAADANGLPYSDTIPGLVLYPIPAVEGRQPALEIRTVADSETLDQHVRLVAHAFHMSPNLVRALIPMNLIHRPRWRSYVGYAEGQPVAASALFISDGVAGVYWVATSEGYRRRGFGEAMTWHVIREGAAAGCRVATLQASDTGRPIYERMGFRHVAGYKTFVRPEPSGTSTVRRGQTSSTSSPAV